MCWGDVVQYILCTWQGGIWAGGVGPLEYKGNGKETGTWIDILKIIKQINKIDIFLHIS